MQIRVQGPTFLSPNDETAMFEWFGRITAIRNVSCEGRDLVIALKSSPTDAFEICLPFSSATGWI